MMGACDRRTEEGEKDTQWQVKAGPGGSSLEIRDMLGRKVIVPKEIKRVICLRAGSLRMLTYLDGASLVAGIEEPERTADRTYLMANPGLRDLPVIGPLMGGDPEMIASARADLIFLTFVTRAQADELQSRTGIPVIALEYGNFGNRRGSFYDSLRLMAAIIGKEERAENLISGIEDSISALSNRTSDVPPGSRPRVYIGGVSYSGAHGIVSTQPHYPPFEFIGADNVASVLSGRLINPIQGTYVDKEQLLIWDPEVIFLDLSSLHLMANEITPGTPFARSLSAIKNGRIYGLLPYNNYAASHDFILANAWYAGTVLYPERFQDINIAEKADHIFALFFGKSIYGQVSEDTGGYRNLWSPP